MRVGKRLFCFLAAFALCLFCALPVFSVGAEGEENDSIDLVFDEDVGRYIYYNWDRNLPHAALIVVEYSIGDSESWVPNTEFPYDGYLGEFLYGNYWQDYFRIDKMLLEPETDYYFRIRYEQLISNAVHVRISQEEADSWKYELQMVIPVLYDLVVLPVDSSLTGIELPKKVPCQYNWFFSTMCEVIWEDLSAVGVSKPGWTYIKGEIIPPRGFYKSPNLAARYPIMLTEEGMKQEPVEVSIDPYLMIVVPIGMDSNDLPYATTVLGKPLPSTIEYTTTNELMDEFSISWDFSAVDTSKAGRYPINYTTDLPICFSLPQFSANIAVMESDRIDLSGYSSNILNQILCRWIYEIYDYENIRLQYSVDGGPWQDTHAKRGYDDMIVDGDIRCEYNGRNLYIYFINMEYEEILIRLVYRDEPSNALCIVQTGSGLTIKGLIEGDRGGADQQPQKPPENEQPSPQPEDGGDDPSDKEDEGNSDKEDEGNSGGEDEGNSGGEDEGNSGGEDKGNPGNQSDARGTKDPRTISPTYVNGNEDNISTSDLPASEGTEASTAEEADAPLISLTSTSVFQTMPAQASETSPQTPPDAVSDAAKSNNRDSSQDDVTMEYSTADTISISGLRLQEMLALAGEFVLFENLGVAVELPADFLAGLNIGDNSRFTVRIAREDDTFTLEILLDDAPLSALPPTTVYFPFTLTGSMDEANLACFDAQGREVSAAVYDAALQIVRVEIQATGSYTITERSAAVLPVSAQIADTNINGSPIDGAGEASDVWFTLIIAGIAAAICIGFILLRRKRAAEVGGNG